MVLLMFITASLCSDFRCKCVCKQENKRQIFITTGINFEECKCTNVVHGSWLETCAQKLCECNYDNRNTNVIKTAVIVSIIFCTVMLLFVIADKVLWKFIRMPKKIYDWKQTNLDKRNRVYVNRSMLH